MSEFAPSMRAEIVERANQRCEYCGLSQIGQEATFHVDHVIPRATGGPTTIDNLALACVSCSLRKWAKQTAIDPETEIEVLIFNPRAQIWADHFRWDAEQVIALTAVGRATVAALAMNRPLIIAIRKEEQQHGRHPPP